MSRFSATLFFGESFFVLVTVNGGSGGVSSRDIAVRDNVSRFGDRIDRGGSGSREVEVLSGTSFLDALSTTVLFSYFTDFFGLSTELSVELSDDWRFRLVEVFFFSCLSFPSTLSFFFFFFFFFFDSASDELLSSESSLESLSDEVASAFLCFLSFFFFLDFSFFLPDLGDSDLSRLCFLAFFFLPALVLPERFRFFFSVTVVTTASGTDGGGAGLGVRTSS